MAISASRTTRFGVAGGIAVPAGDFSTKQELNALAFSNAAFDESNAFPNTAWSISDSLDVSIAAGVDTLVITTHKANIQPIRATAAALVITTYPATITGGETNISAGVDTLVISEHVASVEASDATTIGASTQALTVTTYPASVGVAITGTDDALVITENKAGVSLDIINTPASLTIFPQVASVEFGPGTDTEIGNTAPLLAITTYPITITYDVEVFAKASTLTVSEHQAVIGQTFPAPLREDLQGGARAWSDQAARRKHNQRVMDDDKEFMEMAKQALPEMMKFYNQGK